MRRTSTGDKIIRKKEDLMKKGLKKSRKIEEEKEKQNGKSKKINKVFGKNRIINIY